MKRIDFENGTITGNILGAALPMLIAQILNLLYNIVDRIYIARIPEIGTAALGAVGLCFPIIVIITAFSNLFGTGGAPLFSIFRGKKDPDTARRIMNTSFTMLCVCAVILMAVGFLFARPILILFGASADAIVYAYPYMMLYLIGTLPSMIAVGMNPFINAQGYSSIGMLSVAIGAGTNLVLDPLFIFALGLGVRGAAGFIMQLTNSLVTICCNNILSVTSGDIYISVMTIISSVRQLVETPIHAMVEGTSPILSYNYGARRPGRVRKSILIMSLLVFGYTAVMWSMIILIPETLIRIFSSDAALIQDAVPALNMYFAAFIFMDLQYIGQAVFKSLNKKVFAIFFSLLRKVFIVVPLTYFLPYVMHMGTDGVFLAEPVSNVIGGTACILTMLITIMPELKRIEVENRRAE